MKSLKAMLDVMAGMAFIEYFSLNIVYECLLSVQYIGAALAIQLSSSPMTNPTYSHPYTRTSLPISVAETRQGIYKEYTVDKTDSASTIVDNVARGYKTAEETEESKNKVREIRSIMMTESDSCVRSSNWYRGSNGLMDSPTVSVAIFLVYSFMYVCTRIHYSHWLLSYTNSTVLYLYIM